MRLAFVLFFLVSCRSEPTKPPAPVSVSHEDAGHDAGAPAEEMTREATSHVETPHVETPPPRRPLPSETALRAVFKGTNARGLLAVTGDGRREAFPIDSALDADRPVLVASFTKLWIAVTTLRFVARKEINLDDSISTLLPELKSKPWSDSTVRDLLSHTSRVPEFDNGFFTRTDVDFTRAAPTLAKELSAATEKRGIWKYRNSEYAILGAILEARSGASVAAVLSKEVFTPAGMKHAGVVVKGRPADVDFVPMGRVRPENFFTAGDGYASANDLLAFFEALDADALLDAASKALLFDGDPKRDRAALGCWAYPYAAPDGGTSLLVERPGGFGNVKLVTVFYPEEHRALVFWTGAPLDVGKPRTKGSLASKLAHALLD